MDNDNDDDIGDLLVGKVDQLTAAALAGGPISVQILRAERVSDKKQPLIIEISGGHMPFKPCLTMRRIIAEAWGTKLGRYKGRWLTLFNDRKVKYGDDERGGVRISHMSDLPESFTSLLPSTKGKVGSHTIRPFVPPREEPPTPTDLQTLLKWLGHATSDRGGWTKAQVKAILVEHGSANPADIAPEKRDAIVAIVRNPPQPADDGPPPGAGVEGW